MVEQTAEPSVYEGKSRLELQQMFVEMAKEILSKKADVPIVQEDPAKGFVLRQQWDYTDNSPLGIFDYRCDELLPAAFIAGFKDWVNLAPMAPLGVTMTLLEQVDGFDIIRQFTPAPWGSMMANRSVISCMYLISDATNPESFTMIVTSLGNEQFEKKYTDNGLLAGDVIAMTFAYWHVDAVKDADGKTVGTQITLIGKLKPNGWIPNLALSTIQARQAQSIDMVIDAIKKRT